MILTDPFNQIEDDTNILKYQKAGNICTNVLNDIINKIKLDMTISELCDYGDNMIIKYINNVFDDIKYKGICFPTCISKSHMAGYYSPSNLDKIENGDILKIELGVHIDGFPSLICYTHLFGNNFNDKVSNTYNAAIDCSREILKMMTPTYSNIDVSNKMANIADKYGCSLPIINDNIHAPGIMSYQMSQYVIDGFNEWDDDYVHHFILSRSNQQYDFEQSKTNFDDGEVYGIDILISSGSGKLNKIDDEYPTIYKRIVDKRELLKNKSSREVLSLFDNKDRFPVNMKNKINGKFKLGIKECLNKGLIESYSPISGKKDDVIVRIKFTVIVGNKPILICGKSPNNELKKLNK